MCDENYYFILWSFACIISMIGLFFAKKDKQKVFQHLLYRLFNKDTELTAINERNTNSKNSEQKPLIKK